MNLFVGSELIKDEREIIIYSIDNFLDITANWIYYQMVHLTKFAPAVFCATRSNASNFPYEPVFSLSDLHPSRRLYNKIIRKLTKRSCYKYHNDAITKLEPSLIHSHFGMRGFADLELKKKHGLPLITSFYGIDATMIPQQDPRWLGKYDQLFLKGDLFLVEAPNMKDILIHLGCDPRKIIIQTLGVDFSNIKFKERKREGKLRILIASSFREKKGIPDSLEAIGRMKERIGDFSITIIGGAVNLPGSRDEELNIRNMIRKYDLGDKTILKGFMQHDAMMEESYKHDIFFATSKTATSGDSEGGTNIVLLEMAASGLPILATNHCDLRLTMSDANRKFLAEENNIDSIVESLERLLDANWDVIGKDNRSHVGEYYNIEQQLKKLEIIYSGCIEATA